MSPLAAPSCPSAANLAANLAALGERNADLAEALAGVSPHPDLVLAETPQGVPAGILDGRQLCSRHRPLDEADRLIEKIDLIEHAVVVVFGFGMGYHVRQLAARAGQATLIVVFEPDLRLLRSVLEQADHSAWLQKAMVLFITDPSDRGMLGHKLQGAESILAQGVEFLDHPASRARLGDSVAAFTRIFGDFIGSAKTTLMTTLIRSVDTVRNLMLNLDHYAAGPGIADLENAASGFPAVVVSAGPSLHKNVRLLAAPGVRDRCVIIAVQTTLRPLLAAGIRPHFVTALDYHEISRRFYEGLDPATLEGVTLIADPKAHPVILDSFPGTVRCCSNGFLDKLMGPAARPMGDVPAGATVAHLAVYLARFLGCDPIAMIGQDLGFPDGLYYAPGTAIHEVWAPELNPFNTIEMMEWQRIVRHRLHLIKATDVHGKSIYTDAQMHTYLQQFERDFAEYKRQGRTIIDATEGGVAKQHVKTMPLADVLAAHATRPLPALPRSRRGLDADRLKAASRRLETVRNDIRVLKMTSDETANLIRSMLEHQGDAARMAAHFRRVEANRKIVDERFAAFELLNQINQLGVFRRMKADRRLHMQRSLDPVARQRGQLERDLQNVTWIADAATEFTDQLDRSRRLLQGETVDHRPQAAADPFASESEAERPPSRVAAMIAIDPERNGLSLARSLATDFGGRSVLQATLERLGRSETLETIILITPRSFDVEPLIDRKRIGLPVEIETVEGSPFGLEHEAVAAARLWASSCWRGGVAGVGAYDEALCPAAMHPIMVKRGITAALVVGPDWPLVQVAGDQGCDAVVRRHLEHPDQHRVVLTQSPPGLCGCLVNEPLMKEIAQRTRLGTIGGLLVYQPHAPQGDPIARDLNVQVDHRIRQSLARATFDSARQIALLQSIGAEAPNDVDAAAKLLADIEAAQTDPARTRFPRHITLELCVERTGRGIIARQRRAIERREAMPIALAERLFDQIASDGPDDVVITLAGAGDPLLHPRFDAIIRLARERGVRGVDVRTELPTPVETLDRLLAARPDVVSVDLHADRASTYEAMHGVDRFKDVLMAIEHLIQNRRRLTSHPGSIGFAMPWIVPHLQRRRETYEDIDSFFDRWQHMLGTAVIEGPPPGDPEPDTLAPAVTPDRVRRRDMMTSLFIRCDGRVAADPWNPNAPVIGDVNETSIAALWPVVAKAQAATIDAAPRPG